MFLHGCGGGGEDENEEDVKTIQPIICESGCKK